MRFPTIWRSDWKQFSWWVIPLAISFAVPATVLASKHSTPVPHKVSGREYPVRADGATPTLTVTADTSSYIHRLKIEWRGAAPTGMTGLRSGGGVNYVIYRQRFDPKYPSDWQVLSEAYGRTGALTTWDDQKYDPSFPYRYAVRGHLFSNPNTFGQGSTLAALTESAVQLTPAELTPFLETADEGKKCTASEVKSKPPPIPEKPTEQDVAKIRRGHQCHRKATQNLIEAQTRVIRARGGLEANELQDTKNAVIAAASEWATSENQVIERRKGITTDEQEKARLGEQQKSASAAATVNTTATTSDVGRADPDETKTPCDITEEKSLAEKIPGVGGLVTAGKTITQPSNAIRNAVEQLKCTIADLYAQLMKWLLRCWVLNAAKVEDLNAALGRGGGQAIGGCIETDTATSAASPAASPTQAGGTAGSGQQTGGLGPTPGINPAAKSREGASRSGKNPIQGGIQREVNKILKKKSSLRPLLHFVFGIKPAQATLAQELREGGPAEWVVTAWRAVLTVVNSFAAIVLLVIAIANIAHINIEAFGFRRALPAMIIGVVLANFSLTLIRFLLDLSNGFSLAIVDAQRLVTGGPPGDIATVISRGLATALGPGVYSGQAILGGTWFEPLAFLGDIGGFMVSIILLTIAAVALFLVGAILWARIVVIFLLIILAPLALFFYPLPFPQLQEQSKKWLAQMINWVFVYPVIIFFLWLGTLAGQATAGAGGATAIGYATLLILLFFAFMAPFKMIPIGGAQMESLLKKGPGFLAKKGWQGYGSLMARAGQVGKNAAPGTRMAKLGSAIRASNLYGTGGAVAGWAKSQSEEEEKRRRSAGYQGAIGRWFGGPTWFSDTKKNYREKYAGVNDPTVLESRFKDRLGKDLTVAQFGKLRSASKVGEIDDLAKDTGIDSDNLVEAQEVLNKMYGTRTAGAMTRDMERGRGGHGVVPYVTGGRGPAGAAAEVTTAEHMKTITNTAEVDPVEARAVVEAADQEGTEAELDREIDRGLGAVDGRGGGKVGTELQGIAPGARKRLASIMSGILDPAELKGALAQDEEFKGLSPAQLTALMSAQQQIGPGVQAKQNLEQLRLKSGLGNLNEQQEFGRQHQGFEAPVVRSNITRLDQALNLVNNQRELTPDFQRQLQGTLAGIQVKTTDPQSGNVRITSLDRTLGSAVLGDRTQLIRTLTNQRAGAQAIAANPGQGVDQIFRQQGTGLVSRATANQTVGQVVKLVGETAPPNIKTAITQPNHPLRRNLTGAVQTNVRALLEQQGVKIQANNPEFTRRVNQTVEQLVGTIGNNLTPGQRVPAKQMQTQVELQMREAVTKNFGQFLQNKPVTAQPATRQPVAGGNKQRQAAAATTAARPVILVPTGATDIPASPSRERTTEEELRTRGPAKGILRSAKELAKGRATTGGPTPTSTAEGPKSIPTTEDTVVGGKP